MNKTKIEWCDFTWNPVTGCLHGCDYCYARKIANRFGVKEKGEAIFLSEVELNVKPDNPYPYGFKPTFHKYRLDEPQKLKKPSIIFICSMADLFGDWVPDEWIEKVFEACEKAPQHTYMFLTKNPGRYTVLSSYCKLPARHWYGTTITSQRDADGMIDRQFVGKRFLSIEPLKDIIVTYAIADYDWIIVGAETGTGEKPPHPDMVQILINQCNGSNYKGVRVPLFLKNNLKWNEKIQEFPEDKE